MLGVGSTPDLRKTEVLALTDFFKILHLILRQWQVLEVNRGSFQNMTLVH